MLDKIINSTIIVTLYVQFMYNVVELRFTELLISFIKLFVSKKKRDQYTNMSSNSLEKHIKIIKFWYQSDWEPPKILKFWVILSPYYYIDPHV